MVFQNENTFQKYFDRDNEKLFHALYDKAIKSVESEFGNTYFMIINGKKVRGPKNIHHFSPNDRQLILGYVQRASGSQVRNAIKAARRAFNIWGTMKYQHRIRIFRKIAQLMRKRKFELAVWLTFENGKNRYEAIGDIDEAIDFINYYIEEMDHNLGFISPSMTHARNEKNTSVMKPYGVWAVISPFNFPAAILVGMTTAVLITGNTVVVKPASDTPIIGNKIAEIFVEGGLPEGVINFITGSGSEIGRLLVESKDIEGIVFTGSREVGYELIRKSSEARPRPLIAELGGKNAAIIARTANLENAVEGVAKAAFSYSAQKCSACSRVYVQKNIKSEFLSRLVEKTKGLVIGNPVNADTYVGPLINSNAYEKFQKYSKLAQKDGRILYGGSLERSRGLNNGYYALPTIVTNLPEDHILFKKELFVPILCVSEFDKFEDALGMCNKSEYGLTAGVYTKSKEEIKKFLNQIEAGVVYVNRKASATTGAMVGRQSFGGWKDSGTTGKGTGGRYYLTQFMREQSQTIVA
jgi:1-pyrroline-5-carboxylate dehydrogenase